MPSLQTEKPRLGFGETADDSLCDPYRRLLSDLHYAQMQNNQLTTFYHQIVIYCKYY